MWALFFKQGYYVPLALCILLICVSIYLFRRKDSDAKVFGYFFLTASLLFVLPCGIALYECHKDCNREYTMIVDVYLNPESPKRLTFKSWQERIKVEYGESKWVPELKVSRKRNDVVTIYTETRTLYKVNAPVEIVSYTYKIKD